MMQRAFDLLVSACALLVLSPVLLAIAAWVRLDSSGPALFRQQRVGRGGVPFTILKFRTMHRSAPGPQITVGGDARITAAGAFLRRSKLDELPQLINVLRGDMSIVGPRPEVPRYVAMYSDADRRAVLGVRPGITDPASIALRDESEVLAAADDPERHYVEVLLPAKLALSRDYIARRTLWTDLGVIGRTLAAVLRG